MKENRGNKILKETKLLPRQQTEDSDKFEKFSKFEVV
jgi:hypothetical protein